jgi:hypothetical protein
VFDIFLRVNFKPEGNTVANQMVLGGSGYAGMSGKIPLKNSTFFHFSSGSVYSGITGSVYSGIGGSV